MNSNKKMGMNSDAPKGLAVTDPPVAQTISFSQ